jgi:hypothetical protein
MVVRIKPRRIRSALRISVRCVGRFCGGRSSREQNEAASIVQSISYRCRRALGEFLERRLAVRTPQRFDLQETLRALDGARGDRGILLWYTLQSEDLAERFCPMGKKIALAHAACASDLRHSELSAACRKYLAHCPSQPP